jgi:RHS repeat-associated protein
VETVAKACGTTPDRSKDVTSDVRTAYDGGAYNAAPTKGDATSVATLKNHDGTKATYLETGATFDGYGRVLTSTDLTATVTVDGTAAPVRTARDDGRTTKTSFSPATGLPAQTTTTTPPAKTGDATTTQTTTTTIDPLRSQPLTQTDTNGMVTEFTYDALGRNAKVWLANRRTTQTPSYEFAYRVAEGKPVAVTTKRLNNNGGQISSHLLYDGFLRERQSQTPGPNGGRILADTFYDERGLATKTFTPYYADGAPSMELFKPVDALAVETQTRTTFDGLGRPVQSRQIAGNGDGGTILSTTKTIYGGDRTTVIPPAGGTATTTLTDARGQTTELRQHHSRNIDAAYDTTTYRHTPHGQLAKVTDPAGNSWTYTYDQLGRQTKTDDPDKGITTTVYDDRGQVTSTTDARNTSLFNIYDNLGRRLELREGSATGNLRANWAYDTLTGAKGQLTEATRYQAGHAYTTKVTQYDRLYRPIRTAVVIPDSEGALAGTYQSGTSYAPSGLVGGFSYSAAGALPGGSVNYTYEDQTLRPTAVFGQGMTTSVKYSNTGKPLQYELGLTDGGKKTWTTNTYEWGTQRLATSRVDREEQAGVDRHATYKYDDMGNILSISDTSRTGSDNQCFTYDYLRRVTEAWSQPSNACATTPSTSAVGGPAPYWNSYTYDKVGNRLAETRHDPAGDTGKDTQRTYAYPAAGGKQPHTLSSVTTKNADGTKTDVYTYDPTGNTVARPGQTLTWDAEGHLAKVTESGKTTEYLYDTDGNRLIGRTDTEATLYLGHTEVTLTKGATTAKATRYIDVGGGHQVIRDDDGTFDFTLADHHGTGQLAINADTLAIDQRRTDLFGNPRGQASTAWPGTKGFVGGTDDTKATGLTHLGAREYDPGIGRFISVDPIMDLADPQQMQGYVYANNNPVSFTDPTGLKAFKCSSSECNGEVQFKESHVSPNITSGETWESKYPWASKNYDYYDNRVFKSECDSWCAAALDKAASAEPSTKNLSGLCGVSVSSGCSTYVEDGPGIIMGMVLPDADEWVSCLNDIGINSHCGWAATDLPLAKPVKVVAKILEATKKGKKAPDGLPGCKCFLAGTGVLMADGSTKSIEDVELGDEVLATDPETGETRAREVTRLIRTEDDKHFNTLSIATESGIEELTATYEHPFWSPSEKSWIEAGDLAPGMTLRTDDGDTVIVTANRAFTKHARTYNLTVNDLHTYYVLAGNTPILVHNSNGLCGVWQSEFDNLPKGKQGHVREMPDEETMRGAFERWTAGAEQLQARGPKIPDVYQLQDGTVIQWRTASASGGATVDIQPGAGGKPLKVHLP